MKQTKKEFTKLSVTPKTRKALEVACVEEYRKHHPEMDNVIITHDKILYEVTKYYLEQ